MEVDQNSRISFSGDVRGFCVLCAFRKHIEAALEPSRSVVIPTLLVENLKCILLFL
jgi:hypothetical protein